MKIFAGDQKALTAGRLKINEEYKKNKSVTNEDSIKTVSHLHSQILLFFPCFTLYVSLYRELNI